MSKSKKAPSGEWLGNPRLSPEDIQHESFKVAKQFAEFYVRNRKGRVYILMDSDFYQRFLVAVRKKFGNISASSIEKATSDAVRIWIEEAESK